MTRTRQAARPCVQATAPLTPAAEALLAYVRQHDYVTFAEQPRVLAPYIPVQGGWAMESGACANLVFWVGMSREWLDVLHELLDTQLITQEPCSLVCYLVDGEALTVPLATRPTLHGYKRPHWTPTCLRPGEAVRV